MTKEERKNFKAREMAKQALRIGSACLLNKMMFKIYVESDFSDILSYFLFTGNSELIHVILRHFPIKNLSLFIRRNTHLISNQDLKIMLKYIQEGIDNKNIPYNYWYPQIQKTIESKEINDYKRQVLEIFLEKK
jgi:hypothetical protein